MIGQEEIYNVFCVDGLGNGCGCKKYVSVKSSSITTEYYKYREYPFDLFPARSFVCPYCATKCYIDYLNKEQKYIINSFTNKRKIGIKVIVKKKKKI